MNVRATEYTIRYSLFCIRVFPFRGLRALKYKLEKNAKHKKQDAPLKGAVRRSSLIRKFRIASAILLCVGLVFSVVMLTAYFLLAGKSGEDSILVTQMETALENLVGDEFAVDMKDVSVGFSINGKANVEANNVRINRKSNAETLATISSVKVQANFISALSGKAAFDTVTIADAAVNADLFGAAGGFLLPPHLDKPLNALGEALFRLQTNMQSEGFQKFQINNLAIAGAVFGRRQKDPVIFQSLIVEPKSTGVFGLTGEMKTDVSNINLSSTYKKDAAGQAVYEFETSGVGLREWLPDPLTDEGIIGSDGILDLQGRIGFRKDQTALDPILKITSGKNALRIGKEDLTETAKIALNFRLILDRNQIELDPSQIEIGNLKASLIGGVKPKNDEAGYAGPLLYDIIMERGEFVSTIPGEEVVPAGFKVAGVYDRVINELEMNTIVLTTQNGSVQGSGVFGFTGDTPSLKAEGYTDGISVLALKQFWPFFIADGAREWVHGHVLGGRVVSGTLFADIPPGKIFRLKQGQKLKPEEFKTVLNMEDFAFQSFGELPPVRNGTGTLSLEGMQISATISEGEVTDGVKKPVKVQSGTFVMDDFEAANKTGKTSIRLSGDAQSIALIADSKPLRVMERIKVSASQFSGDANADVAAEFPIRKGIEYDDVKWNVLLDLQNAASSKPIAERRFSASNLVIDANPFSATVLGTTNIDGVKAQVKFVEPIGKSGKIKRSRTITASMNDADRKKLGFELKPVLEGPIDIKISQSSSGEKFEVDFENANLSLPWIGWSKGKRIPAKANFDLKQSKGQYSLDNFSIDGLGFSAAGKLIFDKRGVILADLSNLALNEGDSVQLKLERKKDAYEINASGASFDARGVMNTLIYESSFKQAQGGRSVNLVANFGKVVGFKNRVILDSTLRYQSVNGSLSLVDMTGRDEANATYSVQARKANNQTSFVIRSTNAGNALAFTNIYTRMVGGQLAASLNQIDRGPYSGPVQIRNFEVVDEPRLKVFATNVRTQLPADRDEARIIIPENVEKRSRFVLAESKIEKGDGYLNIQDAIIRNATLGLTATGIVYNKKDRMNLSGTFMPANVVNSVVSKIPILGALLSDRDNPFIGITYRLSGQRANPELVVNPLSIVAPGIFKKVFEFNN